MDIDDVVRIMIDFRENADVDSECKVETQDAKRRVGMWECASQLQGIQLDLLARIAYFDVIHTYLGLTDRWLLPNRFELNTIRVVAQEGAFKSG